MNFLKSRQEIDDFFLEKYVSPYIPDLDVKTARLLENGDDSYAIDFGLIIVRYPKDIEGLESLRFEARVTSKIDLPFIQTPKNKVIESDFPFSYHAKIQGEALTEAIYRALSPAQKQDLADKLARFYAHIHSMDQQSLQEMGVRNLPAYVSANDMKKNKEAFIPDSVSEAFDRFIRLYDVFTHDQQDIVFGYFDAHGENMAFNNMTKDLEGIFDFADCAMGDVHQEFHPLNDISIELVEKVVSSYSAITKRHINIKKTHMYSLMCYFSDMYEIHYGTYQGSGWTDFKDKLIPLLNVIEGATT